VSTTFDGSTATALAIGPDVQAALVGHARAARPLEACGVIYGVYSADGVALARGCGRLANVASNPEHEYRFDPVQQGEVWDAVRGLGFEVLAVWHTHPSGPETPSSTDLDAMQPWLLYPVLSRTPESCKWMMKVFRLDAEGGAELVPLSIGVQIPEHPSK
jgi:proteasome lid subunit RPN8/RPN11